MRAPMMLPGALPRAGLAPTPVEFNPRSMDLLSGIDPKLAELMIAVEAAHPDAFEISEGMRSAERQAQMVAEGKSQTMNSKHRTGNAVDIHMLGPDGQPNWDFEAYRPIADTAKATAASMGIPDFVWGGDWKSLRDGVHFQIGGKGGSGAIPAGAGEVPLSFGADVAPVQDPTAMGLAEMFGTGGLDMGVGSLLPKRPDAEQVLLAQAQQKADMDRKIALADLMRF